MSRQRREEALHVRLDSNDFVDWKNSPTMEVELRPHISHVTAVRIHSVTLEQNVKQTKQRILQWTMDEEKDARATHPAVWDYVEAADKTVYSLQVDGNYDNPTALEDLSKQMLTTMFSTTPAICAVEENTTIGATNLWRASAAFPDAAGVDPITGVAGQIALSQFDSYIPNATTTPQLIFVPRILIEEGKDKKTVIYSNFRLRLRHNGYNGSQVLNELSSLAYQMGFDLYDKEGVAIEDPGTREYIHQTIESASGFHIPVRADSLSGDRYMWKLTSDRQSRLFSKPCAFITTDSFPVDGRLTNRGLHSLSLLGTLPLGDANSLITYGPQNFAPRYVSTNTLTSFSIQLRDEDGNLMEFVDTPRMKVEVMFWHS